MSNNYNTLRILHKKKKKDEKSQVKMIRNNEQKYRK